MKKIAEEFMIRSASSWKEETLLSMGQVKRNENSLTKATYLVKRCHCNWTSIISFHGRRIKFHWWFLAKEMHWSSRRLLLFPPCHISMKNVSNDSWMLSDDHCIVQKSNKLLTHEKFAESLSAEERPKTWTVLRKEYLRTSHKNLTRSVRNGERFFEPPFHYWDTVSIWFRGIKKFDKSF